MMVTMMGTIMIGFPLDIGDRKLIGKSINKKVVMAL